MINFLLFLNNISYSFFKWHYPLSAIGFLGRQIVNELTLFAGTNVKLLK